MKHYITPDNKIYGFDETQVDLIPNNAVEIFSTFTFDQYPYLILINGEISYNQTQHNSDIDKTKIKQQTFETIKTSALTKLTALGLTENEIKALIG